MNSLNSLYFPGTTLYSVSQYPLFLLFSKVHLLKVAEHNIHGNGGEATDSFIKSGLCQPHIPSPLGDDLKRFIHLINDIKNRKDDYGSQLSALTLAAMPAYSPNSGDSRQEIISSLLSGGQLFPNKQKDQKDLEIWQARLVLAIGEILDHEEEDIARQLAVLKDEETELFKELQGEGDDFEEETPFENLSLTLKNMRPPTPGNMKKRLVSWKRLYKAGDIPACDLLLTTSRDSADQIFESVDRENKEPVIYSGRLSLPATVGSNEDDAIEQIRMYQENNKAMINEISENLLYLATCNTLSKENSSKPILSSFVKPWEKSLESHFPANKFGRTTLSFYCFADTPCSTLLEIDSRNSTRNNGLLAIADITPGRA